MQKDATTKARDPGFVIQRTVLCGPAEDAGIVPSHSTKPIHARVQAILPAGCAVLILAKGPNGRFYPDPANNKLWRWGRSCCNPKLVYSAYSRGVAMQTRVQKWGNSLGVRIPRGLAEEIGLGAGTEVSLTAKDGELVVKPALPTRLSLDDLLSGVSESNIHSFVDTGSAVGAEIF